MSVQLYPSLSQPALFASYDSKWRVAPASDSTSVVGSAPKEILVEDGAPVAGAIAAKNNLSINPVASNGVKPAQLKHRTPRNRGAFGGKNPRPLK